MGDDREFEKDRELDLEANKFELFFIGFHSNQTDLQLTNLGLAKFVCNDRGSL